MSIKLKCYFEVLKETPDAIFLKDCDIGTSVTNDADNVYKYLQIMKPGCRVIYMDTEGDWAEIYIGKTPWGSTGICFKGYDGPLP